MLPSNSRLASLSYLKVVNGYGIMFVSLDVAIDVKRGSAKKLMLKVESGYSLVFLEKLQIFGVLFLDFSAKIEWSVYFIVSF